MKSLLVALVYDLRSEYLAAGFDEDAVAEFDTEDTIDALASALERLGHRVVRVGNGRALARRLADGAAFDLVFSIAEGLSGRSREAQVPALCELYAQAYVFSDPLTLAVSLDKAAAKRIVRDCGIPTAPFIVYAPGDTVADPGLGWPVFVKPVAEGTGKGCGIASVCADVGSLTHAVTALTERFAQPVIVEAFLPGREFTIGVVGDGEVVGVMEIVLREGADANVYSYRNKEQCETLVTYRKADDAPARAAAERAVAAYRALGCRDAARLDFRCDAQGEPTFIEANPLAGLHPLHSDLPIAAALDGHRYDWLIDRIVTHAAGRYGLTGSTRRVVRRTSLVVPVLHAAEPGREDESDTVEAAQAVRAALERQGYASAVRRFSADRDAMGAIAAERPLVVFNLVEALDGRSDGACLAPWWYERLGLPYTGNGFEALMATASKLGVKGRLLAAGVPVPGLVAAQEHGGFAILKPDREHASVGIDAASVVPWPNVDVERGAREARFGTAFFAEAFIDGREFNVSLLERGGAVVVLPIQETAFVDWPDGRARVVDFEAKWAPESLASRHTPRRFGVEQEDPELAAHLSSLALTAWSVLGLRGYARIDFRVDGERQAFAVDVNANPGLGPDAGFVAAAAQAGLGFDELVRALVAAALTRLDAAA